MSKYSYLDEVDALAPLLQGADHIDVQTVVSTVSLREFVAAIFNHQPAWVRFLFRVRGGFVRVFGLKQSGVPGPARMRPESVPMQVGAKASFFEVRLADDGHYWLAEATDSHLSAALGVIVEPLDNHLKRFHLLTVVRYHNWTGPVYFNIIRPFHYLVMRGKLMVGSRGAYALAPTTV